MCQFSAKKMTNTKVSENLKAICLMVVAMAGFAIEDSIIKTLSERLAPGQVLIMIGIGGTSVFYVLAHIRNAGLTRSTVRDPWVIARSVSELLGTVFFVLSLTLVPITVISAVIQVSPLLVTLGAALLLGEKVGLRRWSAITLGLFGVGVILRPWDADFQPAVLFTVIGVIGLSARDLATRRVPVETSSLSLAILGMGATIPAGLLLMGFSSKILVPTSNEIILILLSIFIAVLAYSCIIRAMRIGEVSAVVPFRYSRLLFGVFIGVWYFGESLDQWTVIGSAIVVTSGLYSLWREMRLS